MSEIMRQMRALNACFTRGMPDFSGVQGLKLARLGGKTVEQATLTTGQVHRGEVTGGCSEST